MNLHAQTLVQHGDRQAEVDEDMAPLILWLWERGFSTTSSCCDFQSATDGAVGVYVGFASLPEAERFAGLLPKSWGPMLLEVDPELDGVDEWTPVGTVAVGIRPGIGASTVLAVVEEATG